jgi:hypothetical protein
MKNSQLGFAVPYERIRREEVDISLGNFQGYEKTDCVRFTHYELPDFLGGTGEKIDLGMVTIPLENISVIVAQLLSIVIESKDCPSIKYMNEHRLEWLIKKMDEFKAIEREI